MSEDWQPVEMELVRGRHLLRVRRTYSPYRVSWFVVPLEEVKRAPNWFNLGKGASRAIARGYSRTFERVQQDAVAMADAIAKGCAYCGAEAQGHYSVHRDGFGIGPEVPLCDECGGNPLTPTLPEIWERLSRRPELKATGWGVLS